MKSSDGETNRSPVSSPLVIEDESRTVTAKSAVEVRFGNPWSVAVISNL